MVVGCLDPGTYKVICYFSNWAWYRNEPAKYDPSDIDEDLCTHIAYGFVTLNPTTYKIKIHDPWADTTNSKNFT